MSCNAMRVLVLLSSVTTFNALAIMFGIKLITVNFDDSFLIQNDLYTKITATCYILGCLVSHVIREILRYSNDAALLFYFIDLVCNISLYTQPMACTVVMIYGQSMHMSCLKSFEQTIVEQVQRHYSRSEERSEERLEERLEERSEERLEPRPEERLEERLEPRLEPRPEERPEERLEERSGTTRGTPVVLGQVLSQNVQTINELNHIERLVLESLREHMPRPVYSV